MIKFTGSNEKGEEILGLGLSQGNWEKLLAGQPIHVKLSELHMGWKGEILIMGGATEQAMYDELRRLGVLRETEIHRDDTDPHKKAS